MIPMAFYYPNEHAHMWFDIPFAYAIVAAAIIWHPEKLESRMGMFWWVPFGKVPEISATQLDVWRSDGTAQILDVRTGPEYRSSHVPGALHTPVTDFGAQLAALQLDKSRPVVAICLSAHRSIPAVRALQEQGFRNACQLEGGMLAWWKAKLPTVGDGSVDARAANALQKASASPPASAAKTTANTESNGSSDLDK
jgi:rhodanese-related sulfurtransferase